MEKLQNNDHLVKIKLGDGSYIKFRRTVKKELQICHEDHCINIPGASGQIALDLFALLEPFGESIEE